jgi:flavin reductase (DIM6/NTAB) family NADH-FMN oxidoreductase RutF
MKAQKQSLGSKPLLYPTPAWVICTYDGQGRPNMMTAAWANICCSKPVCVTVSLRQATHTYGAIMERKAFCVCVPTSAHIRAVDYVGIVSGRDRNKFSDTGLTAVRSEQVDAPYVAEFPLTAECRLVQTVDLGLHTQFIGQILDIKADPEVLDDQSLPSMEKVNPPVFAPRVRRYYAVAHEIGRGFHLGKEMRPPQNEN